MREIKFRCWDKINNRMLPPVDPWDFGYEEGYGILFGGFPVERDQAVLQQYTGLKDKNGVEIYEGDVIIFDNSDIGGQRYKGIVEWNTDPTLDGLCFGLFIPPKFGNLPDPSCSANRESNKQSQMWVKSGWLSTD